MEDERENYALSKGISANTWVTDCMACVSNVLDNILAGEGPEEKPEKN